MSDMIAAFFEQLARGGYVPLLRTISGSYRFEIEGRGNWGVVVDEGKLGVTRTLPQADTVFQGTAEVFTDMLEGKQNPTTAFLQGKLNIHGDLSMGQIFTRLFRIRPETFESMRSHL